MPDRISMYGNRQMASITVIPDMHNIVLPGHALLSDVGQDGDDLVLRQPGGLVFVVKGGAREVPTFIIGDAEVPRMVVDRALERGGLIFGGEPDEATRIVPVFEPSPRSFHNGIGKSGLLGDFASFHAPERAERETSELAAAMCIPELSALDLLCDTGDSRLQRLPEKHNGNRPADLTKLLEGLVAASEAAVANDMPAALAEFCPASKEGGPEESVVLEGHVAMDIVDVMGMQCWCSVMMGSDPAPLAY